MYDYVVMLLFDELTKKKIHDLKTILRENKISSREKPWPPHVTVDLYRGITIENLLAAIDDYVKGLKAFEVEIEALADFHGRVLYAKPQDKEEFQLIKQNFDVRLDEYRLKKNRRFNYQPHITLVVNQDINETKSLLHPYFQPWRAEVIALAVYSRTMKLQKNYNWK